MTYKNLLNFFRPFRRLEKKIDRLSLSLARLERKNYQQITNYMELRRILDGPARLPPLRQHAITPDMVFFLMEQFDKYKPKNVLEFGSGVSSLIMARYVVSNEATGTSVESELVHLNKTQHLLKSWGLENTLTVVHADLVEQPTLFYEKSSILGDQFDFVFLDGPQSGRYGKEVRGGLFPLFCDKLAKNCVIVLDDYKRRGERRVVANWLKAGWVDIIEENTFIEKHAAVLRYTGKPG